MSFTDRILDRLEELQEAISLPSEVWDLLILVLCPGIRRKPLPPDGPTTALPGTVEKIKVMAARYQAGRHIYHPDDAIWGTEEDRICLPAVVLRNGLLRKITMADLHFEGHRGRAPARLAAAEEAPEGQIPTPRKRKANNTPPEGFRQKTLWGD